MDDLYIFYNSYNFSHFLDNFLQFWFWLTIFTTFGNFLTTFWQFLTFLFLILIFSYNFDFVLQFRILDNFYNSNNF